MFAYAGALGYDVQKSATMKLLRNYNHSYIALFAVIAPLFLCSAPHVSAHTQGASVEIASGPYLVDIGYDPQNIVEDTQVRLDFALFNATSSEAIDYTDIWLRVERENALYYAGGIPVARLGPTGISYRFPDAGTYDVTLRFQDEDQILADAAFTLDVSVNEEGGSGAGSSPLFTALLLLLGVGIGFTIDRFIVRR